MSIHNQGTVGAETVYQLGHSRGTVWAIFMHELIFFHAIMKNTVEDQSKQNQVGHT